MRGSADNRRRGGKVMITDYKEGIRRGGGEKKGEGSYRRGWGTKEEG